LQEAFGMELAMPVTLSETSQAVQHLVPANQPATVYREDPDSWFARAGAEEQRALNAVNAEVLLPLPGRQKLMGLMTLGPKLSEEPYSPSDLRLLQSVATQTGLALEMSELVHSLAREAAQRERSNREMEIAREVQERLFPQTIPQIPGIGLAGACRPAQGVGGDYYDFIELEDGRLGLAIGDVSGKGISAALLMASLRASLRGMMLDDPHDVARVMTNVNRLVYEASTSNRYATFFFGIFDPAMGQLRYVNAGHNPPVVLHGGGEVTLLDGGGPVVGLLPKLTYQEQLIKLETVNTLLAYTDGISEAMTADEEEWGEKRMIEAAKEALSCSADEVIRHIFAEADKFTKAAPQHDDMTLLVMKVEGFYRL
jgi:sigma-B regulation protein RsbU (phosphoserine phosphatase)